MRGRRRAIGLLCLVVAGCHGADPSASPDAEVSAEPSVGASPAQSATADPPTGEPSQAAEPGDPTVALQGRAMEAIGAGGIDVVARVGATGFRLPENERVFDISGDRVLSARLEGGDGDPELVVRTIEGDIVRVIDPGMDIPQTGIVRGEDVYFGGVSLPEGSTNSFEAFDRGAWVAHGDAPPVPVLAAVQGVAVYTSIERSPDGRTIGIWRCGAACETLLVGTAGDVVTIPRPGLIALPNDVALVIGKFSDVTAYAVSDGAEVWRAETTGVYYGRYATNDGERIVISSIEDAGDDDASTTDELRIDVLEALTGTVQTSVLLSTDDRLAWLEPALSTDRYVAILDAVLPNVDEDPGEIRVVDLEAARLLGITLSFGDVP